VDGSAVSIILVTAAIAALFLIIYIVNAAFRQHIWHDDYGKERRRRKLIIIMIIIISYGKEAVCKKCLPTHLLSKYDSIPF
jgi:hypothetical protein